MTNRRTFLNKAGKLTAAAGLIPLLDVFRTEEVIAATRQIEHLSPVDAAQDEDYWAIIRQAYTVSPNILNLNNGGVSPQATVTQDALDRYTREANQGPAYYMWQIIGQEREIVRKQLAELGGVDPEEVVINRNTTEGFATVIFGMNLKEGDEVLTTSQDYPHFLNVLHQLEMRSKIKAVKINFPVPCEDPALIVEKFKSAITPKTKVLLMCHVIYLTGQIMPVRAVADMAHEKGIDVICDGAHSFAHLDFKIPDLHCDYYAASLHKWLCAPFGSGMLWIKKEKIKNLWPLTGAAEPLSEDVRKFENLGTRSFPIEAAIGTAISFHNGIGIKRKEERLRFLKNYWAEKVSKMPKVIMSTSMKREYSCGIGTFVVEGRNHQEILGKLFTEYKIFTKEINEDGLIGLRIGPNIYTSLKELDYFVNAMEKIIKT